MDELNDLLVLGICPECKVFLEEVDNEEDTYYCQSCGEFYEIQ